MAGKNNDQLYQLINDLRLEIKGDIHDVASSVAGRFDKIEKTQAATDDKVNKLVTSQATTNIKIGVISFIGSSLAGAIIASVIGKFVT